MAFRREIAAETLINAAAALRATWSAISLDVQERVKRLIDEYGHEIFQKNAANRVVSMGRLLDKISELPGLPQPVLDALAAGSGTSGMGFVRISDEERDRVLEALTQVHDARRYEEPYQLAEELRRRIKLAAAALPTDTRTDWENLEAAYAATGNVYEYLGAVEVLLADRLPFVRKQINSGKSWAAVPRLSAARPPSAGSKGLDDRAQAFPDSAAEDPAGRGLESAPTSAAPGPPSLVQRSANVYFPKTVQLAQKMIPLIVHIARAQAGHTVEIKQGSSSITVSVGDLKIFVLTADFTIERAIGGAEIEDVDHGRIVRVDPVKDCEPVVFFLSPTSAGDKRISIEFKQLGKRIGSLAFDASVIEEAVPATQLVNAVSSDVPFPLAARAVTGTQIVEVPDLDLRVGRQGNILTYALSSADGKYDEKKLGQKALQIDPGPYFADIALELSDLAAKPRERRTAEDKELPAQLGAQLWDQLLSDEFRQVYKDDLRKNYWGKSLKITTDEPWIPWEMLRPVELESGTFVVDDPPLCEVFRLTRWLDGRGAPDQVQLKRGVIVAPPEETLPSVVEELAYFTSLPWVAPVRTKEEVNRELSMGAGQLFHFSCHGYVDERDAWLKLGEEYMKASSILYGRHVDLSTAFIFLNACDVGQTKQTITGLGGWAQAFLRRYASVFIGSLWSINDRLATQFARSFYDCLFGLKGQPPQPISVAFHTARQAIKETDPDNPTWLAYVLYADPNGRVYVNR